MSSKRITKHTRKKVEEILAAAEKTPRRSRQKQMSVESCPCKVCVAKKEDMEERGVTMSQAMDERTMWVHIFTNGLPGGDEFMEEDVQEAMDLMLCDDVFDVASSSRYVKHYSSGAVNFLPSDVNYA